MAKNKNQIVNNCTLVELHGEIALKFGQYVIDNRKDIPGIRGASSFGPDYYQGVFFSEAYPLIEKFMKDNKVKRTESGSYIQYKEKN